MQLKTLQVDLKSYYISYSAPLNLKMISQSNQMCSLHLLSHMLLIQNYFSINSQASNSQLFNPQAITHQCHFKLQGLQNSKTSQKQKVLTSKKILLSVQYYTKLSYLRKLITHQIQQPKFLLSASYLTQTKLNHLFYQHLKIMIGNKISIEKNIFDPHKESLQQIKKEQRDNKRG